MSGSEAGDVELRTRARGRETLATGERDGEAERRLPLRQLRLELKAPVHHVIPIEQGGEPFLISNLVTLCRTCHESAEREAKSGFLREGAHTRPPTEVEKPADLPSSMATSR